MVVYFGPDNYTDRRNLPKVYIRSLLFSASKRGKVIESIYATINANEFRQNFNIWVYGERGKLVRGSGLYVGESGVSCDHHFLTPTDDTEFRFREGRYRLELFIKTVGSKSIRKIFSHDFQITNLLATEMIQKKLGIYFDWGPDAQMYLPHLDKAPEPSPDVEDLIKFLATNANSNGSQTDK